MFAATRSSSPACEACMAELTTVLSAALREKSVPIHRHTIWYYFGGMTLFLFTVQAVTGILLLLYYRPTAESAFESVQFIMAEVRFGWLIRSIHSWSANLMILTLFIHMASVYLTRAYRPPRQMTWITGVALLMLVLAFGFSGYLLPWNKLAFFATQVGTQIVGSVPIAGSFLLRFLRGGAKRYPARMVLHVDVPNAEDRSRASLGIRRRARCDSRIRSVVSRHRCSAVARYGRTAIHDPWMDIAAVRIADDVVGIHGYA